MREALLRLVGRVARGALLAEARCPGCGCVLRCAASVADDGAGTGEDAEEGLAAPAALCADCRAALAPRQGWSCPGCGEYQALPEMRAQGGEASAAGSLPSGLAAEISAQSPPGLCVRCREKPRPWGRVLVYGPYAGQLKEMILGYKFEARLDFGRRLQECALAAFEHGLRAYPELGGPGLVVPVPLHPRRLLARGFNQSLEIARLLSARHGWPLHQEALARVRRTTPQMELAREARAENIRGAFAARGEILAGRAVLLVDDIMTTGATLEECSRAMLGAGAARVDLLVLARA